MIIDCVSDLHGHYPKLEGGDLLIVAGDLTAKDEKDEYLIFGDWIKKQNYKNKIVICGNHDNRIEKIHRDCKIPDDLGLPKMFINPFMLFGVEYLCDSGTEFEYHVDGFPEEDEGFLPSGKRTIKIWGSPWTKTFEGINPHCKAFTLDTEEELAKKWELIPDDLDILITHCPPFGILDMTCDRRQVGSTTLMAEHFIKRIHPKLWVWGHVHESYGLEGPYKWNKTTYVNASHVNEQYEPVNKPIRIIL